MSPSTRPIDTMGVGHVVKLLRIHEFGPVYKLAKRMPWPVPGGLRKLPSFRGQSFVLADPVAVYVFTIAKRPKLASTLGVGIYWPTGSTIEQGFLFQRFLAWLEDGELKATPQAPVEHIHGKLERNTADGPAGITADLAAEVAHAIAGLHHATKSGS
jgi:hypothetical protein